MMLCAVLMAAGNLGRACLHGFFSRNLCTAIFGLGYGAVWPVYASFAADYFSKRSTGSVVGLWTLHSIVASMISPAIAG